MGSHSPICACRYTLKPPASAATTARHVCVSPPHELSSPLKHPTVVDQEARGTDPVASTRNTTR
ncbi:hypothetical protein PI124_g23989, partial [Phytophthora idaei]